ncbi:type II toxin-antitoxin system TacA family antitoxin [Desulfoplanes sp.]
MNTASQNTKTERINLRVKSRAKELITLAAGFEGKTVSNFILTSALKHAEKTVQEHQSMSLNAKESQAFLGALSGPVRFTTKLSEAFEEYDQRVVAK